MLFIFNTIIYSTMQYTYPIFMQPRPSMVITTPSPPLVDHWCSMAAMLTCTAPHSYRVSSVIVIVLYIIVCLILCLV